MEIKVTRVDDFGNDIVEQTETSNETTETNDTADTSTGDNTTDNNTSDNPSDTSQDETRFEIDDNSALEYIKNKFAH